MDRLFVSALLAVGLVALGLVYFGLSAGTSEVLTPMELSQRDPAVTLHRIRVAGRVAAAPAFVYSVEPYTELRFHINNPGGAELPSPLPVVYRGIKPDMFEAGRDVIIDGEFSGGVLKASSLMTQCPSKYEAPSPDEKYSPASAS